MNNETLFSKQKWIAYAQLMRFDKPIGTLLLLHPTLWALFIAAEGMPPVAIFSHFYPWGNRYACGRLCD